MPWAHVITARYTSVAGHMLVSEATITNYTCRSPAQHGVLHMPLTILAIGRVPSACAVQCTGNSAHPRPRPVVSVYWDPTYTLMQPTRPAAWILRLLHPV